MRQLPLGVRLRERASFESFLPAGNGVAVDVLQELAAFRRRGVFWLAGAAGSGKSHLLQAVCVAAAREHRAAYLPLRELQAGGPEVLSGWHDTQSMCIDDVDVVLGQRSWEVALFNLHRELDERGASLVMSASAPPRGLKFALPDFASRAAHALLLTLGALSDEEQRDALQRHASLRGLELPDETANYLLRRVPRDMERLVALLDELDLAALQAQRRLTVPFVREVLGPERAGSAAR
jgi:DnaA family protein